MNELQTGTLEQESISPLLYISIYHNTKKQSTDSYSIVHW
jgi:hypothetical protein